MKNHPLTLFQRKVLACLSRKLGWIGLFLWLCMGSLQAQVTANFSATPTTGCTPLVVQFSDLSTGGVNFWQWDFGNGNTSTLPNPSTTYLNPGTYSVTLITGNGTSRDTLVMTNFITVFPEPIPDFNFGPSSGCQPLQVVFTDNSAPGGVPITNWLWDFGDGNTSPQQNPIHIYTTAGNFSVSLQVTDGAGCSASFAIPSAVTVFPKPVAQFTAAPTSSCDTPLTVQFTDGSTNATSWNWEFGDGNTSNAQNPSHTYTNAGLYTVTLFVGSANGCRDTLVMTNLISNGISTAAIAASDSAICPGDTIQLFNNSTPSGTTVRWEVPGIDTVSQQNPFLTFEEPGSYDVQFFINYGNGCFDTLFYPGWIFVDSIPDSAFTGSPVVSCTAPLTTNFVSANQPNVSYFWDFGDLSTGTGPTPSHTYTNPGYYTVSLISINTTGCSDTSEIPLMVRIAPPSASIIADTVMGCVPLDVDFLANIGFTSSPITSYQWDLGNGVTSTLPNPSTTYTTPGVYNITLIITNAEGCSDTVFQPSMIQAGVQPTANFGINPNPACGRETVQFTDSSTNANGWFWDFGDGNFAYSQNAQHLYPDTGLFYIRLVVDNFGCTDTLIDTVRILPAIAEFDWDPKPVCDPFDSVAFLESTVGADSVSWNFGGGLITNQWNPIHVFGSTGLFTVSLYAYNFTTGCADTATHIIQVTNPHIGFFTLDTAGCDPYTVQFTDTSSGPPNYWQWDFGDTGFSLQQNPTHTYTQPGIYSVHLLVRTIWGCEMDTTLTQLVTVGGINPFINAVPNPVCLTDTLQFFNNSYSPVGVASWSWDFGDGGTSLLEDPKHAYNNPGNYDVIVVQTDSLGCIGVDTVPVTVGTGFFNILVDSVHCIGDTVPFFNFSTTNATFNWEFGDGSTDTVYAPTHYYDTLGTYPMVFTGQDPIGCTDTIAQNIYIVDPVPGFTANPTVGSCPPMLVQFTNTSSWDIVGWEWDFGDGGTSTIANPSHNYLLPGNYDVQLIVTSAGGCKDTLVMPQFIQVSGPTATFQLLPDSGCSPHSVSFQATGSNVNQWQWDFGDGNVLIGGPTISHTYTNGGTYYPVLIVEDSLGCTVAYPGDTVAVFPTPQVLFNASNTQLCGLGLAINFNNLTTPSGLPINWEWDFGDGVTSTQPNPQHTYTNYGTFSVSLIATTNFGCTDTLVIPNYITLSQPPIAAFSDSTGPGPGPKPWYFTDSSTFYSTPQSWQWSINGTPGSGQQVSHTFSTCGNYPVTLIVTDIAGCSDTATGLISPYPYPIVDAGANASFCAGGSGAQLAASIVGPSAPPYYYQWWCDTTLINCGLDSIFDNDPMALPPNSTMYYVQVTDNLGCQSPVDSVWVEVLPLPLANAGSDPFICPQPAPGSLLSASVNGASPGPYQYQWSPATGLNNPNIANPYARPDTTTIYTLTVVDGNGCTSITTTVDTLSTVTVHVLPQPIAQAGPDRDLCLGEGLQLEGFGSNAGPGYTFEWSPFTGLSDSSIANPFASPPATTDYILTVWSNGCPGSDTVRVRVHALPTADAGPTTDICLGDSTQLNATASGDPFASNYTFQWSPATGLDNPSSAMPMASPISTTVYLVTATSEFGCVGPPDSVRVGIRPTPIAEAGPQQTLCAGDTVQLLGSYGYAGTDTADPSMVYFAWAPSTGLLSDSTLSQPWISPGQSGFYYLQVRHNTCVTLDSVLVTVNPDLGAQAGSDTNRVCQGDSVQLWATGGMGGNAYQWFPPTGVSDPTSANPLAAPSTTTEYWVVLSEGGCTDTAKVRIEVIPSPDASLLHSDPVGCAPHTVVFMDNSAQTQFRIWDFGDGSPVVNTANPAHTYQQAGDYVVSFTGTNTAGCKATNQDLTIHVAPPAVADFTSDPMAPAQLTLPGTEIQFTDRSPRAADWHWKFGDGQESGTQNPNHTYEKAGEYYAKLTITTLEGCVATIQKGPYRIIEPELLIPNVFTPNNDGIGDGFRAEYSGHETYSLSIFDRWGKMLFTTRNHQEFWQGYTDKGDRVAEGVYYYQISVGMKEYAGWVTLMR